MTLDQPALEKAAQTLSKVVVGKPIDDLSLDRAEQRANHRAGVVTDINQPTQEEIREYALAAISTYLDAVGDEPIPMLMNCPRCDCPHIDEGEWATRSHKTHQCQQCETEWRPANVPTVGVLTLPSPPQGESK